MTTGVIRDQKMEENQTRGSKSQEHGAQQNEPRSAHTRPRLLLWLLNSVILKQNLVNLVHNSESLMLKP